MPYAGYLWHNGADNGTFPCMEATYPWSWFFMALWSGGEGQNISLCLCVARLVRLGEEMVGVSVPSEVRCVLDLPARLRLLQTAGFTAHNMTSLLSGLRELYQS